jgi:hypothetical protein
LTYRHSARSSVKFGLSNSADSVFLRPCQIQEARSPPQHRPRSSPHLAGGSPSPLPSTSVSPPPARAVEALSARWRYPNSISPSKNMSMFCGVSFSPLNICRYSRSHPQILS